ncbi:WD40/YVTN/BNR-like repeat-containing protein [Pyxidicoccus sp. MSG2]|uniref:WD40/YVTN/BNR-like repeat-containing protein n=1 Tax=Pyxidicoccus sp. MSG2 TaxID=2996790 RepID=UPI002272220F|nr:YCF48-related protein [Pyxidicoccus sp. MSG2]MCY1019795.1 YCF48-related protein [Pyxidicoccus sp. MSG2]
MDPTLLVDLGVQELDYQRVASVAQRMEGDWWAVVKGSRRGSPSNEAVPFQIMRSADAGRSWREEPELTAVLSRGIIDDHHNLDLFVWYTPDIGIIAGYMGARVLRTVDAGRTWHSVPLSEDLWVYDLERAGERTWLCGSSGGIHRSDDAGAHWRALKGTPFNDFDRCRSMSFLDTERGWALGSSGTLWETRDGGEHWQQLTAPEPPLVDSALRPPEPDRLLQVVRLTPEVGWLAGEASRFQTTDGGKTWHARPLTSEEQDSGLGLAVTPSGQQVITLGTVRGAPASWVPALNEDAVAMGENAVVTLGGSQLRTHVSGRLAWAGPLRSAGTGVATPLDGIAQKSSAEWLGWSGEHVVATFDAGRSWVKVGRFPQTPIQRLVFLKTGTALARTATGTLLRSRDVHFGREWVIATEAMDTYDFEMNAGPSAGEARVSSPFECLRSTAPATVDVRFIEQGCEHYVENTLRLELTRDGASLSGRLEESRLTVESVRVDHWKADALKLSRTEGERILRELEEAATHEEAPTGCGSTNSREVVLEWACPSSPVKEGRLVFKADKCGGHESLTRWPGGYARALHLFQIAARTVKNASPRSTTPLP